MNRPALAAALLAFVHALHAQELVAPVVEVIGRYDDSLGVSDAASQGVVTRQGLERRPLLRARWSRRCPA